MKIGRAIIWGIVIFAAIAIIGAAINNKTEENQEVMPEIVEEVDTELRGVWVSTVSNLDYPSSDNLSVDELKSELDGIVANVKKWNLNTIFFQIHPCSDAFYKSDIFPTSSFLSQDAIDFDPLQYLIEICEKEGISVHGWINPLRASLTTEIEGEYLSAHPEYCIEYDGKLYLDAGNPEVRELVCNCVQEVIENYSVDGIHFDDYFYPYPVDGCTFDDSVSYEKYGNGMTLEDFRRNAVNELVKSVGETVKNYNPDLIFGISPFGIWASIDNMENGSDTGNSLQSYYDLYADSLSWAKNGYVDYLAPQIYWSTNQPNVEFCKVYDWWENALKDTNTDLYIGLAAYKVGLEDYGWNNEDEFKSQIEYVRNNSAKGFILFRYGNLCENKLNLCQSW